MLGFTRAGQASSVWQTDLPSQLEGRRELPQDRPGGVCGPGLLDSNIGCNAIAWPHPPAGEAGSAASFACAWKLFHSSPRWCVLVSFVSLERNT